MRLPEMKLLPGTFGFGVIYDDLNRSVYVSFSAWTVKFHWPRVGLCRHCGHGPGWHSADRSRGVLVWTCGWTGDEREACYCDHYSPEGA